MNGKAAAGHEETAHEFNQYFSEKLEQDLYPCITSLQCLINLLSKQYQLI